MNTIRRWVKMSDGVSDLINRISIGLQRENSVHYAIESIISQLSYFPYESNK